MTNSTPSNREAASARSGDTHVIGADGAVINIDAQARAAASRAASVQPPAKKLAKKPPVEI